MSHRLWIQAWQGSQAPIQLTGCLSGCLTVMTGHSLLTVRFVRPHSFNERRFTKLATLCARVDTTLSVQLLPQPSVRVYSAVIAHSKGTADSGKEVHPSFNSVKFAGRTCKTSWTLLPRSCSRIHISPCDTLWFQPMIQPCKLKLCSAVRAYRHSQSPSYEESAAFAMFSCTRFVKPASSCRLLHT